MRDRLATLDYFKMKALFDYMDIAPPKDFYVCMCAQNRHTTGSGVGEGATPEEHLFVGFMVVIHVGNLVARTRASIRPCEHRG